MKFLRKYWRWLCSAWIGFVFIQSLFFKFSGSPETRHIFGILGEWSGLEWFARFGAYGVGIAELVASILLISRWWAWGALLAFEIMSGAILFHLFTPLGIKMPIFDAAGIATNATDGGLLFIMACVTWVCALTLVVKDWVSEHSQIRNVLPRGHN